MSAERSVLPKVATFGELLLRLDAPGYDRLTQATSFHVRYTGAEANAAVALAQFGHPTRVISAVPANELGDACIQYLRQFGVGTEHILRAGPRLGILYVEKGASVRPASVVYDRAGSSFSQLKPGQVPWANALSGCRWLHWSGTAPALAPELAEVIAEGCRAARSMGLLVSCDLNFRSRLWSAERARSVMEGLMEHVDVLIGNEEHIGLVLQERVDATATARKTEVERCTALAEQLCRRFRFKHVAITLRETHGLSEVGWRCLLSSGSFTAVSQSHSVVPVDRIGAGDAFAGGLIHGMLQGMSLQACIEFAAAAGCLKHTISGDFLIASAEDVWRVTRGEGIGRIQR